MLLFCPCTQLSCYRSSVQPNTLSPVWNELWKVKNVPSHANLHIEVLDKDNGNITDDYIGNINTTVAPGAKELTIEGPSLRRNRGTFWLKVPHTIQPEQDLRKLMFHLLRLTLNPPKIPNRKPEPTFSMAPSVIPAISLPRSVDSPTSTMPDSTRRGRCIFEVYASSSETPNSHGTRTTRLRRPFSKVQPPSPYARPSRQATAYYTRARHRTVLESSKAPKTS